MFNKKVMGISALVIAGTFVAGSAFASTKIGTVTGKDGDVKDLLNINAEVTQAEGSHVTLKDSDTGAEYQTSLGPSWYTQIYEVGEAVSVEAVETEGDNDNGHNLQVLKVNDTVLRESFEGKPAWAGTRGAGNQAGGQSNGQGMRNGSQGNQMTDANGDGVCDNQE